MGGGSGYGDDSFGAYFCSTSSQKVTWDCALGSEPRPIDYTVPLAGGIPVVWFGTTGRFVLGFLSALGADDGSQEFSLTNYRNGCLSRDGSSFLLIFQLFVYSRAKMLNCEGDFYSPTDGASGNVWGYLRLSYMGCLRAQLAFKR